MIGARSRGVGVDAVSPIPNRSPIDRRPVTVAIVVGVIIGFAEAAPLFQLPLFFRAVLEYGALGATLATAPFIVALVVAGPIAGSSSPASGHAAWSRLAWPPSASATSWRPSSSARKSPMSA